jgi:hypothetical protein
MTQMLILFLALIPLYVMIALGYIATHLFKLDRTTLANLSLFILSPIVAFGFVVDLHFRPEYSLLPFIGFIMITATGLLFYAVGKKIYPDNRANLLAICASHGNTGYFGLPLVLSLFDEKWVAIYMFLLLGGALYETTFSYYFAARGNFTLRQSLEKIMRFPTLYAILAGLAINQMGGGIPDFLQPSWANIKGAYIVLGMMIIGAALASGHNTKPAPQFIALAFLGKFVICPLMGFAFIALDNVLLKLYPPEIHTLILIFCLVPPGANIAIFASQMNLRPGKAATTILLGTIFALFYIPAILWIIK